MDRPESPENHTLGDGVAALAVDRPASLADLREAVSRRAAEGQAIYPQGGRTALDYGGTPRRPGVALDVSALNGVIDYPAADMTVTVGAGITLASLQATLASEGQFLPLDAPSPERATLGGIYATDTSGPRRFGWGRPRDLIIGVSFVTADGKEVKGGGRVVKNVAGYDFPKLMTGSMGTLGVITQMTLKVRPKPEASALVALPFDEIAALETAVKRLNTSATRPVAVEAVNSPGLSAAGLRGGFERAAWVLVVGLEDNAASVAWQVDALLKEVGKGRSACLVAEGEDSAPLWRGLTEFPATESFGPLTLAASLPRSQAIPFAARLDPGRWAAKVQPGSGIVVAHARGEARDEPVRTLRAEAGRLGGGLILSRCPADRKASLGVWGDRRGDWSVMERIKAALDPACVLNPGRFVGTI